MSSVRVTVLASGDAPVLVSTYPSSTVLAESGIHPSTYHRRVIRLERDGVLRRGIRIGGPGGTCSAIIYRGSLVQLVALIQQVPEKQIDRRVCAVCGHNVPKSMWVETIREQVRRELERPEYSALSRRPQGGRD